MRANERRILAKELAANPLLPELTKNLKQTYFDAWLLEPDQTQRDKLWIKCQVLDDVESDLLAIVTDEGLNYE